MKMRVVDIVSRETGEHIAATLVLCPHCDCDVFNVYFLQANHPHLQCASCGTSYCQAGGSCPSPTEKTKEN
jgi:hypothetical protein